MVSLLVGRSSDAWWVKLRSKVLKLFHSHLPYDNAKKRVLLCVVSEKYKIIVNTIAIKVMPVIKNIHTHYTTHFDEQVR